MSLSLDLCTAWLSGGDSGVDLPFRIYAWMISLVSSRLGEARTVSAWFLGLMRSNYALNEVIHVCHFVCIFSSIHLLLNLSLNCKLVLSRLLCLTSFCNQWKTTQIIMFSSQLIQIRNLIKWLKNTQPK